MAKLPTDASELSPDGPSGPWYRELDRYHWLVLIVCTLGWMFDCLDQQLFNLARQPALAELMGLASDSPKVAKFAGYATSIMLIGWATGGILFGIMGDRMGRARTMVWTILAYSIFTGMSGLSQTVWDFLLYRFLTGLGVGGQFAVGVALVAEVMPDRVRPYALGMLQALSAVGNVTAAVISLSLVEMQYSGALTHSPWRWMFAFGVLPALLAVIVIRHLKEPERWKKATEEGKKTRHKSGSVRELFGDPRWRKNAIVGMLLASSGVIGLWGIGFFSIDMNRTIFRRKAEQKARDEGQAELDRQFVLLAIESPDQIDELEKTGKPINPLSLLSPEAGNRDPQLLYAAVLELRENKEALLIESVLTKAKAGKDGEQLSDKDVGRLRAYLQEPAESAHTMTEHANRIGERVRDVKHEMGFWGGITSLLFNIGAFFGIYAFTRVTARLGRRPTFAMAFILAGISTVCAFMFMRTPMQLLFMVPIMGFFQLSVFGGYAIYFPELFPTRLRSTGTSFCYNIGRYVAALGPWALGLLTGSVFVGSAEPMRYAGVTMCCVFLLGVLILPFAPETKGKPLPE